MMGFGDRLYPAYDRYNGIGGKGIDKMIDQLIAIDDELPGVTGRSETNEIHTNTVNPKQMGGMPCIRGLRIQSFPDLEHAIYARRCIMLLKLCEEANF